MTTQVTPGRCCSLQHIDPADLSLSPSVGSQVVCRRCGLGQPQALSAASSSSTAAANLQLQCHPAPLPAGMQGCLPSTSLLKAFRVHLKNPCMESGNQPGCFQTLVLSPRRKKIDNQINILYEQQEQFGFCYIQID